MPAERDAYDAAIAAQDQAIGELLSELDHRHLLDSTIVAIAADHGEEFREHGFKGFVAKPYDIDALVQVLHDALAREDR